MKKTIEVLEIKNDSNLGLIVGCHTHEWDGMDESEISNWFEDHRTIAFADGTVMEFSRIIPFASACFGGGKGQAILRLSESSVASVRTPAIAYLQ